MKQIPYHDFAIGAEVALSEALPATRDERRLVELNGYVTREDNSIVDVKIVDLSYDGCAVRTVTPLKPGEKLRLSLLGRGALHATVRWYRSRVAGLLFLPDGPTRPQWPRKEDRIGVLSEVGLRRGGQLSYRVRLFDVTRFGCKCEFVERPTIYERLWVKFDGVEAIESVVCWLETSTVGLMFTHPFHPAVFDFVLSRLQPVADADVAT